MPALFLAFLAVLVLSFGGRDQLLIAQLSARSGQSTAVLLAGAISATVAAGAIAAGGAWMAGMMSPSARTMFVALALGLAAFELVWPVRVTRPAEPTRSLFAVFLVLLWRQVTDAARFVALAVIVATSAPLPGGIGAALGGLLATALPWAAGDALEAHVPLRAIRIGLAVLVLIAAIVLGLSARGLVA
ncbi:hypothetical protein [Pseudopontixanthobacter vadosimaris]|uniref:hypothetical protein n=1 Tax=Pseudopontixanthobacter vadosimaris TaxID=2726450 RepID=UPI001474ADB6